MLPQEFISRMKFILGDRYSEYEKAVFSEKSSALRINRKKSNSVLTKAVENELRLERIPYASDAYYFDFEKPGNHPCHHAGLFYVQEPSAMMPVASLEGLLPENSAIKILDSCASPGGKSSQIANIVSDGSIIVSNEIVPSRCKTLVSNTERQGFRNFIILNSDTKHISDKFRGEFAVIICDAPCSGEGMFRKSAEAREEWSEENVKICAQRQREILSNLAPCVCNGGYLLYSTCTFSPEENEMNVSFFLENFPEFSLCRPGKKLIESTCPGIEQYCTGFDKEYVRRFYPHIAHGEGQFFALFKKDGELIEGTDFSYKDGSRALTKDENKAAESFLLDTIGKIPRNIRVYGENIIILPDGMKVPENKVFLCGVKLGEYKSGRIIPHHQFFSAFGREFTRKLSFAHDSEEIKKYLHGDGFECECADGWCVVCTEGTPVGGAKVVSGYLKNHYPKGLRTLS